MLALVRCPVRNVQKKIFATNVTKKKELQLRSSCSWLRYSGVRVPELYFSFFWPLLHIKFKNKIATREYKFLTCIFLFFWPLLQIKKKIAAREYEFPSCKLGSTYSGVISFFNTNLMNIFFSKVLKGPRSLVPCTHKR